MTNVLALPSGTLLVGDFRIERVLGAGGFGMTYLAEEIALARKVTIKEYFPTDFAARGPDGLSAMPRDEDSAEDFKWGLDRFIDEAQTLARFDHRHIVRVYRYFKANGTAYMVLSFEEGESLKAWLRRLGRAPRQRELDDILGPLLEALEAIHAADYLHRDIAPDNIMIRPDGTPVLIDFGSARGEIATRSRTVSALVKPGYSPYEQYAESGVRQGPWTDIYALGATLYHAICGKRPPDAPSRVVNDELAPPHEVALAAYRQRFLGAVERALTLDPYGRPQSIAAWRGDLLAPDPVRPSLLQRAMGRAAPTGADTPAAGGTRKLTAQPGMVPPPPDAPGAPGQMLDYVEGLKQSAQAAPDRLSAPPAAAAVTPQPAAPQPVTPLASIEPLRPVTTGPGSGGKAPGGRAKAASKPSGPSGTRSAEKLPVPAQPKPARPRAARVGARVWRSFAFKFAIGAGIAGTAIAYQDRLPAFLRGDGNPGASKGAAGVVVAPARVVTAASPAKPGAAQGPAASGSANPTSASLARAAAPDPARFTMLQGHSGGASAVGFTADGRSIVTAGADGTLKVWNATTGASVRTITPAEGPATAMAVLGQRALTGHADGRVVLWDVDSGRRIAGYRRAEAGITAVGFAQDGQRVVASSKDATLALWDAGAPQNPVGLVEAHDGPVTAVAAADRGPYIATGGEDNAVRLWRAGDLKLVRTYRGHREPVAALAFSPDGRHLAAAAHDGRIRVWSTSSSSLWRLNSQHKGRVRGLAFSPGGDMIASVGEDGTVQLWQLRQSRTVRAGAEGGTPARAVAFTPDGSRTAVASADGSVRFWDVTLPGRGGR